MTTPTPDPRPWCWAALTAPTFHGPFPTEAEALADARSQGHAGQIRLGRLVQAPASAYLDSESLLVDLRAEAKYWSSGDSDLWLTCLPHAARADLETRLSQALDDWASQHGLHPNFCRAEDTQLVPL